MDGYLTYLRELNMASMMLRLTMAVLMGGIIGFDREMKHRPAGFRTYMLVAMGAAVTMVLSQYLDRMLSTAWRGAYEAVGNRTDVVRLGAQVISGIGFIGTGTILITERSEVKGLTTASGLWASACMGVAIGAGFYECVIIGFVLILLCMKFLPFIERAIMTSARNMNIYIEMDSMENMGNIVNLLKAEKIQLYDVEINRAKTEGSGTQIGALFLVCLPRKRQHAEVLADLATLDGIVAIEEV